MFSTAAAFDRSRHHTQRRTCAATPHNLHTPIAAARIRKLFPDAIALATLKEPVWRMRSAHNQFSANFKGECNPARPQPWCPVYRYYQMEVPSFADVLQRELQYMEGQGVHPTVSPIICQLFWSAVKLEAHVFNCVGVCVCVCVCICMALHRIAHIS